MFSPEIYQNRRSQLINSMDSGIILLLGNDEAPMNYHDNAYPFRQDSSFLYFVGIDVAGYAAIIDIDKGRTIVYGSPVSVNDIVWMGPQSTPEEYCELTGADRSVDIANLGTYLLKQKKKKRKIHFLPPYRGDNTLKLSSLLGVNSTKIKSKVSQQLISKVVKLRSLKGPEEITEIEDALAISKEMHESAMSYSTSRNYEYEIWSLVKSIVNRHSVETAYPVILTIDGHFLHNYNRSNKLKYRSLLLGDFGAESKRHYASDITRTFPIAKKFTVKQRDIYDIVLRAEMECIELCKPALSFHRVHQHAATVIASGLKDLGIMKGNPEDAVREGAHALFFPHGLGHMIGLDVHDMEDLGEDFVGYSKNIKRSKQFGLNHLRFAKRLKENHVLTVEPGIYFIPELISQWKSKKKHKNFINYTKLENYLNFGGIRIEDNVIITEDGSRILGPPIAKTVEEIEDLRV